MNDGRRRLTVREAARLQSFPDWFEFSGSATSQFTQIGNTVPPMLAYGIATQVADHIGRASTPVAPLAENLRDKTRWRWADGFEENRRCG